MIITKIERQKKNTSRRSVFLNGRYAFSLSENLYVSSGISEGEHLSTERIEELRRSESQELAKSYALRYRSIRPRSEHEIREYLKKKECSPQTIDEAIAWLYQINLLNDEEFALMFTRDTIRLRPVGRSGMRALLKKKGINSDVIDRILTSQFDDSAEFDAAYQLALKKLNRTKNISQQKLKKRILDYLLRRGFPSSLATQIVKKIISQ